MTVFLLYNLSTQSRRSQTKVGTRMMRYEWVVALVLGALLLTPVLYASWVLLVSALRSPMVAVVPRTKRTTVQWVVVVLGLYGCYISWAVLHCREPTGKNIILMTVTLVGVALLTLLLWGWCRRLMGPHAAFDNGSCRPRDLRAAVGSYYDAVEAPGEVTLSTLNGKEVTLEWGEGRKCKLRPASGHSAASLLAAAHFLFPTAFDTLTITMKGGKPRARYVNSSDTAP